MELVDKDKLDILNEIKESNASELTRMRAEWDTLQNRVQELEGKLDVSRTIVREVCSERNALRAARDSREEELRDEDQQTLHEMKKLLEELTARMNGTSEAPELSPLDLLRQFAETTEKSADNLAKRAEVSLHIFPPNYLHNIIALALPFALYIPFSFSSFPCAFISPHESRNNIEELNLKGRLLSIALPKQRVDPFLGQEQQHHKALAPIFFFADICHYRLYRSLPPVHVCFDPTVFYRGHFASLCPERSGILC